MNAIAWQYLKGCTTVRADRDQNIYLGLGVESLRIYV